MGIGRAVALIVVLQACPAAAQGRAAAAPPEHCTALPKADSIAGVSPEGDLRLASGALVRLADVRIPDESGPRSAALAWLRGLDGRRVALRGGPPDRWGRAAARVTPEGDGEGRDVAHRLVAAGLALVDPSEAEGLCAPDLLAAEQEARGQRLGLWAEVRPIPVREVERLRARTGRFALVEGRVLGVGERGARTYLNFGRAWSEDFTITIPKRSWAMMLARGLSAEALRGRGVGARGVIEEWNGPALKIHAPDMIELLDAPPPRR